ncbi:hypothetical protein FA95DRAFT_966349 [Auriscalpium vulgare]|uniref:Uncharacterized protein n=1 Tax=Auriscalpium vulgare TaxID=40419 RepID=A0ACB8R7P9_9AGAM|nr:hypothetical protein FA95DRAFT_966349 [Auriscalpium vulgare]
MRAPRLPCTPPPCNIMARSRPCLARPCAACQIQHPQQQPIMPDSSLLIYTLVLCTSCGEKPRHKQHYTESGCRTTRRRRRRRAETVPERSTSTAACRARGRYDVRQSTVTARLHWCLVDRAHLVRPERTDDVAQVPLACDTKSN